MAEVEEEDRKLVDLLIAIGRGEASLAEVIGLNKERLQRVGERAVGLIRAGQVEVGERLLESVAIVDAFAPAPVLLLAFARASRGDHRGAIEAYREAVLRADKASIPMLAQRGWFGAAQSHLQLGEQAPAREALARAAAGPDPQIARDAAAWSAQLGTE
jgi:tetratricopeptide (TPR) repeat protein